MTNKARKMIEQRWRAEALRCTQEISAQSSATMALCTYDTHNVCKCVERGEMTAPHTITVAWEWQSRGCYRQ